MNDDPYKTLGITPDADEKTIKRAYRRKARKTHPDVNRAPDATARFQKVQGAFALLMDKNRKARWDQTGQDDLDESERMADPTDLLMEIFDAALKLIIEDRLAVSIDIFIRDVLAQNLAMKNKLIPEIKKKVARLQTISGKIGYTGPGENILAERVEYLLGESIAAKVTVNRELQRLDAAKEMLNFFTFPEPPAPEPKSCGWNFQVSFPPLS